MSDILTNMLAQLSDEDKVIFKQLSDKLKQLGGDVNQLGQEDLNLIQSMQKKYDDTINQTFQKAQLESNKSEKTEQDQSILDTDQLKQHSLYILEMPFSEHVRQILARDLREKFPEEEEAICFAFDNKWLPLDCQNEELINQLYNQFEADIVEINQWRNDLVDVESDKKMALGLAWFMVIFQLHERFSS